MYVRPTSTRLFRGMLIPAMRAISSPLALPLLVARVLADDEDRPMAADDLALLAHRLHRRSYLQWIPFGSGSVGPALEAVLAAATGSGRAPKARPRTVATGSCPISGPTGLRRGGL